MRTRAALRGYTLLEMIISVGLFSIVMLIATGAYLALIGLDRQARSTSQLMTNLSFAIDSMARSMRTGSCYCSCSLTPTCTSSRFTFRDSDGRTVTYSVASNTIRQRINTGVGTPTDVPITDPAITISSTQGLRFYVVGQAANDDLQPQVVFTVRGSLTDSKGKVTEFAVENSATQRLIDS